MSEYVFVDRYPQEVNEVLTIERWAYGLSSCIIRCALIQRIDGWCVYAWPKYLSDEYAVMYGKTPSYEAILSAGEKMPEQYARELFPGMTGTYAH